LVNIETIYINLQDIRWLTSAFVSSCKHTIRVRLFVCLELYIVLRCIKFNQVLLLNYSDVLNVRSITKYSSPNITTFCKI